VISRHLYCYSGDNDKEENNNDYNKTAAQKLSGAAKILSGEDDFPAGS
jgi:hypothetical protein